MPEARAAEYVPNPCQGWCEFHGYLWCQTWGRAAPDGCADYIDSLAQATIGAPSDNPTDPLGPE